MAEEKKEPEVEEFMEIGGSPVPGITLRQVLRGHTKQINRIAWSPDGRYLASPSRDKTIRIWDKESGECTVILEGHEDTVYGVAWSPDGKILATGSRDHTIRLWLTDIWKPFKILTEHEDYVRDLAWSPDGRILASCSNDRLIILRDIREWSVIKKFEGHRGNVQSISWSANGQFLASGSNDGTARVWDSHTGMALKSFLNLSERIIDVCWHPNGKELVVPIKASIVLIDVATGETTKRLEGHTGEAISTVFSADGTLFASSSWDHTVRIWDTNSFSTLAIIPEEANSSGSSSTLSFNPKSAILCTFCDGQTALRIWSIDYPSLIGIAPQKESVRYTTAKLVLVGDSGVGKTGLGWRLAGNQFKEHSSTHGQQFWVIPELKKARQDGTECEAVLWDLAGQSDYRLVHSLYLDDVDTALVLFDPTNRQEPLSGVDFWLNQLRDKDKKLRNAILVGARTDRGTSTLTKEEIEAYCKRNGITGGYVPTSAKEGEGLPELLERLKSQIPWDQMTTTVTTVTFKKIKEYVLALKEKPDRRNVLVQPDELRKQLQATDTDWQFSDAEMMTAVGHLEHHGYIKIIHSSNGQYSILLAPDLLANLASSIVLEARRNPRGLGVLEEERLLHGEYPFPELINISREEGIILLDAATVLFLQHNLCFRETFNNQTFLVFPSLINEKRPVDESLKIEEDASYRVKGAVENVYASLVVLLGYTNTFTRTHQWQNQAQYEMGEGETCGFIQSEYRNGEIELVLYYDQNTPEPVRLTFRGLFERFLSRRELDISRYQPIICHKCGTPLARNVVMDQLAKKKDFSFCHECGEKLHLPSPEPVSRLSRREEVIMDVEQAVAKRRTAFEAALVRVKGLLRDQGKEKAPTCFISYAWGVPEHEKWVVQLAKDLRNAGIDVLLDRWHSPPGSDLVRYTDQIVKSDFVAVVGTSQLLAKYETQSTDPVVAAELRLINLRLREPSVYGQTVIPLLLDGDVRSSFTPLLQTLVRVDFKQSAFYFRQLFDTIWQIYGLPRDNPLLDELLDSMTPQEKP